MGNQLGAEQMKGLGQALKETLPGLGFALFIFPLGGPGLANYISNGQREDMIKALRETLGRLESGKTIDTPNSN